MSEQLENQDAVEQSSEAIVNPFAEESWIDSVNAEDKTEKVYDAEASLEESESSYVENNEQEESDEEVYDADDYLRQNLGFDSWEVAKEEIEKLRASKGTKYENEESERIHKALLEGKTDEVYSYLERQIKINKLISSEIDEKNAVDIVKLSMKSKYSNLTDEEIDYKFNKQFNFPKQPEQNFDETDEEFQSRYKDWEDKVRDVKMDLMIEAKTSRSEIENLKRDIKLPDLSTQEQRQPTQEELENLKSYVQDYNKSVESAINSFDGFSVGYKDEDVSIQSTYSPSIEEKQAVSDILKNFSANNFDANVIFAERWLTPDGKVDVPQLTRDIALLYSDTKVMQKLVNDGVTKRLSEYRKSTSNIRVNNGSSRNFTPESNQSASMADFFFGQ